MNYTRTSTEPFVLSDKELADFVLAEMDTAIVICDKQMNIALANPAALELFGGNPVGMPFGNAFPLVQDGASDTSEPPTLFSLAPVLRGETLNGMYALQRNGQPKRIVLVHSAPYRGPQSDILCCIVSLTDVTASAIAKQRRTTEFQIANILAQTSSLRQAAPLVLQHLCQGLGWDLAALWQVDEMNGRLHPVSIWHAADERLADFAASTRTTTLAKGEGLPGRVWEQRDLLWLEDVQTESNFPRAPIARHAGLRTAFALPLLSGGQVAGVVEVFTRQVLARDAEIVELARVIGTQLGFFLLRQASLQDLSRLAALVHDSDDAILAKDLNGIILDWNPAAERLYGYTRAEIIGKSVTLLFPPELTSQSEMIMSLISRGESVEHLDTTRVRKDGTRLDVSVTVSPLRNESGEIIGASTIARDIQGRKIQERNQNILLRLTDKFSSSLDFETTLRTVCQIAVPELADWCAVHILMPDHTVRRVAFNHRDPEQVQRVMARAERYELDENAKHLVSYVIRTGITEIYNEVPASVLAEAARDAAHQETLQALGLHAYLCIPLQARGHMLGAITFAMSNSGRKFAPGDTELAQEVVRRAGLAADNALLYRDSQAAQARLQLIAEASNELITSLDMQTRMEHLVKLLVPRFADWCAINLLNDNGAIELAALAHTDPATLPILQEWIANHPLLPNAPNGTPHVIRTGEPEWVPNVKQQDADSVRAAYHARLNVHSYMIVPLLARGRVLGAISFVNSESSREFTRQDLVGAEEIARRAAVALDNAVLFQTEQLARHQAEENERRVRALQNVSQALAPVLTSEQLARIILREGLSALDAQGGVLAQLDRDAQMVEILSWSGYPDERILPWRRFPIEAITPLSEAMRGTLVTLESSAIAQERYPDLHFGEQAYNAWMLVPLGTQNRILGGMLFAFEKERTFTEQERTFALALAQQGAQALERTQLYQAEQAARAEAEQSAARVSALQRVTAALAATLTRDQVEQVIIENGMQALDAQGSLLAQLRPDGQTIEIVRAVGYPLERVERIISVDENMPLADAIRNGELVALESDEESDARYPGRAKSSTFRARLVVPLEFKGRILGALALSFAKPREFSIADRAFAFAFAQQCAQALERARLYEAELAARQAAERAATRSSWLTEASRVLASSLDYETTLKELAQLVVSEFADWCTIDMAVGDGTAEQLVLAHRDPEKLKWAKDYLEEISQYFTPDWNASTGLPNVLRTGKAEIYYDIPDALLQQVAKNEVQLGILRSIGYSSVMIVPLRLQDKTIGAITMVNTDSRKHFTDEDLEFAELFVGRAAVAVENARLYAETQRLNSELEQRVEARTRELSQAYKDLTKEVVERSRAEEMTRALLRISNKLNSTLDVENALDVLIQEAIRMVDGSSGFAGLHIANKMKMLKYHANGKSVPLEYEWDAGKGLPGWVLEHGAPYVTNDAPNDPVLRHELPFNQGISSAICTPIFDAQQQVIAFLAVQDKRSQKPFTDADIDFLTALSPVASIAIQNAQAYRKISDAESAVQTSYAQLRALAARLQSVREEERKDIARELHDELGQVLTALKMDLAALLEGLPKRNKRVRERAEAMMQQIDSTIKTVRRMSSQLRPGMLDDLGLGPSIEWYAQEFQTRTNIAVQVNVPEEFELEHGLATALFRIFQETLTNVARHANATRVQAKLEARQDMVILEIQDNGQGFDMEQVRGKRSLGLLGMRERAEMVAGTLTIDSAPGKGTFVVVSVPLNPKHTARPTQDTAIPDSLPE